jgi:hypothetical protein
MVAPPNKGKKGYLTLLTISVVNLDPVGTRYFMPEFETDLFD